MTDYGFAEWSTRGVWGNPSTFVDPAEGVVVHHSVTNLAGDPLTDARKVEDVIYGRRRTSKFSMNAYSFMAHQSGDTFESRGYRYRNGANNRDKTGAPQLDNGNTISICAIGNYHPDVNGVDTLEPTDELVAAIARIVRDGIATGNIVPDPWIGPHSDLHGTACCGDLLRARIPDIHQLTRTEQSPMHADAVKAQDAGFWNGSNPAEQATREQAAIMAWRSHAESLRLLVEVQNAVNALNVAATTQATTNTELGAAAREATQAAHKNAEDLAALATSVAGTQTGTDGAPIEIKIVGFPGS